MALIIDNETLIISLNVLIKSSLNPLAHAKRQTNLVSPSPNRAVLNQAGIPSCFTTFRHGLLRPVGRKRKLAQLG